MRYYDRVTGERLEVVSKLVPLGLLALEPSPVARDRPDLPALRGARRARPERLPLLRAPHARNRRQPPLG